MKKIWGLMANLTTNNGGKKDTIVFEDEAWEKIGNQNLVLSPWYYDALREDHYTLVEDCKYFK